MLLRIVHPSEVSNPEPGACASSRCSFSSASCQLSDRAVSVVSIARRTLCDFVENIVVLCDFDRLISHVHHRSPIIDSIVDHGGFLTDVRDPGNYASCPVVNSIEGSTLVLFLSVPTPMSWFSSQVPRAGSPIPFLISNTLTLLRWLV